MDSNVPLPLYKCQTCFVSFPTPFELEIHMDAYERLISFLIERISKAATHLIPVKLDPPDADKFSESNDTSKCPMPSCASVKPLKDMKYHFSEHVACFEVCPGCGFCWSNVHGYLVHIQDCLKNADEAKKTHIQRRRRALIHRTVMQLQAAMEEFKSGPFETRPERQVDIDPSLRQRQTPQTAFSGDPSLHPVLSHDPSVNKHKRGTGPVYLASHDTRYLDQAIGLTGPATTGTPQGQSSPQQHPWGAPGLPPSSFIRTDPLPSTAPIKPILPPLSRPVQSPSTVEAPRLIEASPEAPSNMMLSLDEEMDNIMQPMDWLDDFIEGWSPEKL